MEPHHKRLLANYEKLTDAECGFDVIFILDYLMRGDGLQTDEYEEVLAEKTTKARAEYLLDILLVKGQKAYDHFREGMLVNYPHFIQGLDNTPVQDIDGNSLACMVSRSRATSFRENKSILPSLSFKVYGRKEERERFLQWLIKRDPSLRQYLFIGTPGIGKTTLMVTVAQEFLDVCKTCKREAEQILYFDLRSYATMDDLSADVLISIQQVPTKDPSKQMLMIFKALTRDVIFLLDNAEESTIAVEFADAILRSTQAVRIVIASRVSLKSFSSEQVEETLAPFKEDDGICFSQDLVPSLDFLNAKRLCAVTGFLPLGIRLMSILLKGADNYEDVLCELEKSPSMTIELLDSIEGIPISSNIVRCFQSCFSHLDKQQQQALVAFTVFPSTFDRKAAEAVCSSGLTKLKGSYSLIHTHKMLRTLRDRSMVMFQEKNKTYSLHPLLKSFCKTMETEESRSITEECFCKFYIQFTQNCCDFFYQKDCFQKAVQEFWRQRQNVIHCFQMCLRRNDLTKLCQQFASRFGLEFFRIVLPDSLIKKIYTHLLECLDSNETQEKLMVFTSLAFFARVVERDPQASFGYLQEAEKLRDRCKGLDANQMVYFMHTKAKTLAVLGRFSEAEEIAKDSLQVSIEHNDDRESLLLKGFSMEALAGVHKNMFIQTSCVERVKDSNKEYNAVFKYIQLAVGDHIFSRYIHMSHGELRERVGDLEGALDSYKQALQVQNILMADCVDQVLIHVLIGGIHEKLGNLEQACKCLETAFDVSRKILGGSEKSKEVGEKLIGLLKKRGDSENANKYRKMLEQSV